jgi:hypothetical protein
VIDRGYVCQLRLVAAVRLVAFIFFRIFSTCLLAVERLMPREFAISLSDAPVRRSSRTSTSRRVRSHLEATSIGLPPVWGDFFTPVYYDFPLPKSAKNTEFSLYLLPALSESIRAVVNSPQHHQENLYLATTGRSVAEKARRHPGIVRLPKPIRFHRPCSPELTTPPVLLLRVAEDSVGDLRAVERRFFNEFPELFPAEPVEAGEPCPIIRTERLSATTTA